MTSESALIIKDPVSILINLLLFKFTVGMKNLIITMKINLNLKYVKKEKYKQRS